MDHSDRPHLVGTSAAGAAAIEPVTPFKLPENVLLALRDIRDIRENHLRALSADDRRMLAWAEHIQAQYIDLIAQIDASGKDHPSG